MIYLLVIALVAGLLLYALVLSGSNRPVAKRGAGARRSSGRGVNRELVATRWATITATADSGGAGLRNAVSEADKLLDYVMRESGARGETMADRLRSFERRFSDVNGVWRAHKLRNSLAHDVGFDLVASQAREALRDFERGLKDLGAL
ncbi:hypothetical protein KY386_02225 [Candidatus Parcubacteria bacterium]|nr:hypothetical protein [Candidatus Parcubacteria bacterium]